MFSRNRAPAGSLDASSRDLEDQYEAIGLSPATGWLVAIALFFLCGITPVIAYLVAPATFGPGCLLGLFPAFVVAPLSYVGYKKVPNAVWGTHVRLCLGITLIAAGTMMIGEARQAFMMLLLSSAVPPAVYFGVRPSIPYGFGIAALVAAIGSSTDAPWAPALAFCSAVALLTVVVSMMIAQGRTRMYARAHRAMAYSDPLTGLANTRALREALERALNCESSEATPVALFAIDLDNFKLVNDEFDHARGDEVLKAVATELSAAVEPGDMVARRGGDEFSVLIANPEGRDLDTLRESLTDAIHHARMRTCPEISPSGSAAYVHSKPGDEVTSLLREADAELHTAKVEFHQADQGVRRPRLAIIDNRSETDRANEEKASAAALDDRRAEERFDQEKPWWRGSTSVDRPLWGFAAMMTAILGATIGVVSAAGWTGELTASRGGAIAGGFALIVALAAAGSIAPLRASFIHLIFLADVAVLSTAVLVAGESGAALIDLYAIIAMFAFHFFSPAVAARYLPVTIGLYGTLAYTGDFPYAIGRSATFGVMMLSSAVLVGKVRMVTRTFILRNFELSQRDALTSTANVRAMRIRVSGVVKNAETGKREPAIIAIDLDEFKEVNDNFGHSVGDEVLVSVARAILDNVRADDLVARRGGDEFVVITDAVDADYVNRIAQRIGDEIAIARDRICPGLLPTASVAIAEWKPGDDADDLMRRADQMLHDRKVISHERRSAIAS